MTHWINSKPGLNELEEEGRRVTAQAKEGLEKLLQRRKRLWQLIADLSQEKGEK